LRNLEIDFKRIATHFRVMGFNISCVTNQTNKYNISSRTLFKAPSHDWKHLFHTDQTNEEFQGYDWENATGIGTFTGRNNIFVIDIDGCQSENLVNKILNDLNLPSNYQWIVRSGSRNGFHIYYQGEKLKDFAEEDVVTTFPPNKTYEGYFEKMEFLWYTHVILPPSIHGSARRYEFANNMPFQQPAFIDNEVIYKVINKYLAFKDFESGELYGEVFEKISPRGKFISELGEEDISKYLMDNIYCVIDIKTTGLPINNNGRISYPNILQIAWILLGEKGEVLKKKSFIISNDYYNTNSNESYINVDFKIAKKISRPLSQVLLELLGDLKISDFIVGHNLEFSSQILKYHYRQELDGDPVSRLGAICTMEKSVNYCKIPGFGLDYKYPKLSELYYTLFNVRIFPSKNAEIDALNISRCFKKLKKLKKV